MNRECDVQNLCLVFRKIDLQNAIPVNDVRKGSGIALCGPTFVSIFT
ncbi:MAG: hypothetical protein IJL88_02890 [Clostridia bacterium]|nr:hypothetical protein [Clostridia bacterium]